MNNGKLRAILGTGNIAGKYVTAVNNVADASLVAVVSRTLSRAEEFASKHGIEHFSDSLDSLAEKLDFDAVIIATPSGLHAEAAIHAANLKKHVLCEKPLDITLDKIDEMTAACESAGVKLACAFQQRTAPHNQAAYRIPGRPNRKARKNLHRKHLPQKVQRPGLLRQRRMERHLAARWRRTIHPAGRTHS